MTDIGNIRSFITADSTDFDQKLDKAGQKSESFARRATKNFKKVGDEMRSLGKGLSLAVTLPLAAAGAGLLKLASDAEETQNKFDVVFASISDDANMAATSMAAGFNLAGDEAQGLLADTGDLLTGLGFTQRAALDLSVTSNQLAADLASFTNIQGGTTRAAQAVTKAMLGEREMLKALGINVNEAMVKEQMLENAQKGLTFETVMQAKAIATLNLIQKQSPNAIGDTARSMGSFASMMRRATADTRDMAISFGTQLMPVALLALDWAQQISKAFGDLNPQTQRLAIVLGVVAAAAGPLLFIGGTLISMFLGMLSVVAPVVIVLGMIGAALVALPTAVSLVVDTFRGLSNFFGEFGAFMSGEWADLSEDSKTAIEIIAKGWLSLKIAWSVVGNALVGTIRVITEAIASFVGGIEWIAEKFGVDLPKGVKNFSKEMDFVVATLKDVEQQNTETLAELTSSWDKAPEMLREDVNSLVDTFSALPAGIISQLESAFPGAVEAVRNLVGQVQEFIDSGELPPIVLPVVPAVGGGGAAGGADTSDLLGIAAMGNGQLDAWLQQHVDATMAREAVETAALERSNEAWANWSDGVINAVTMWRLSAMDSFSQVGRSFVQNMQTMKSVSKAATSALASTFSQMSTKILGDLFAFAARRIAISAGIVAATAADSAPHPFLIPLFVGIGLAALAAGLQQSGSPNSSSGGGGGGTADTSFSDQTAVTGGAANSQVIGSPESEMEPAPVVIQGVIDGDDLAFVVTRAFVRGSGDGINVPILQGA